MSIKYALSAVLIACLPGLSAAPLTCQAPASSPQTPSIADARTLMDHGRLDQAYAELQQLAAQMPEPAGVERMRGEVFYLKNDLNGAETALASAMKQDPADHEAAAMRGVALFRLGKAAEAVPLLEHAHGTIPGTNVDGTYAFALCLMEVHRYDEARRAFATLYGFTPESYSSYVLAAHMFLRWEQKGAAEQMAQKALTINPHAAEAHMVLGQIALAGNNLDEARLQLKQEVAINPVYGPAYEHLGDALIRKQMYAEAQEVLNRAVLLEPNSTGPFILLGQALLKQNKAGLAVSYLQHAEEMDPANILTHTSLMQAYRMTGNKEEAAKEAKKAQDLQSKQ